MKNRAISGVASVSLLIFLGLAAFFGYAGIKIDGKGESKEVKQDLIKYGGAIITYAPTGNVKPTIEQMNAVKNIMRSRLDAKNYTDANVTMSGSNMVVVEIPKLTDPQIVASELGQTALLELIEPQEQTIVPGQLLNGGQVILKGTDVKSAIAVANQNGGWQIDFTLTSAAQAKFAAETEKLALTHSPIAITLDRVVISAPMVESKIDSQTVTITGNFTHDEAQNLAALISSGSLPFKLKAVDIKHIKSIEE